MCLCAPCLTAAEDTVFSRNALIGKAMKGSPLTAVEVQFIEPVCVLIFNNSGSRHWSETLKGSPLLDQPEYNIAKGAASFHHYCFAEISMMRYYKASTQKEKTAHIIAAINDYSFVVNHPEFRSPDWPYLPMMYMKLGDTLRKTDRKNEAISAYMKALNANENYIPAYLALADFMAQSGVRGKALEYLTEGLRRKPDSRALKRRYDELGGKQPYPEPYPKPEKASDNHQESTPTPTAETSNENANTVTSEPAAQADEPNPAPAASAVQGTPGNPYCRFCP